MDQRSEQFKQQLSEMKRERNNLKGKIQGLEDTIDKQELTIRDKNEEIEHLYQSKDSLKQDNSSLNQKFINYEEENYGFKRTQLDILVQLKYLQEALKVEQDKRAKLQKKLDHALDENYYDKKALREAQAKIARLIEENKYLSKNQAIYIAKRGDAIDEAMAAFINQYPEREKLKILFLRESRGVYRFGSKRVSVKVERGFDVKVKIGGGYISVQ